MIVTVDTTIKDLLTSKLISVRTSNVCLSNKFLKVSDIQKYKELNDSFTNLKNCGRKSHQELMKILSSITVVKTPKTTFDSVSPEALQVVVDEYELFIGNPNEPAEVIADFKTLFPSPSSFFNKISDPLFSFNDDLFDRLKKAPNKYFARVSILNLISEISRQLSRRFSSDDNLVNSFVSLESDLRRSLDLDYLQDYYKFAISEAKKKYLIAKYENLTLKLGGRALNFKRQYFPHFYDLIPYLENDLSSFVNKYSGKRKGAYDFFDKVLKPFREIIQLVVASQAKDEIFCITIRFPWLNSKEIEFVSEFQKSYGHYPLFFLLSTLSKNNPSRELDIFLLRYGLGVGKVAISLNDIASKYNLSRERVRQILSNFSLKKALKIKKEDARGYIDDEILFLENNSNYQSIAKREKVSVSFELFGQLISEFWPMTYVGKYSVQYLVNKELSPTVNQIFSILTGLASAQFAKDTSVAYKDIFSSKICENNEPLKLVRIIANSLNIPTRGQTFFFPQNHIDVENEAYQLLYETGEPISAEEIHNYLKNKYPNDYILAFSTLKVKLLSSERIQCVGKTSTYKLSHWRNIFGGNIRDLLRKLLEESDVPLSLDLLTAKVTDSFDTTRKNIHSNLSSSEDFTTFVGGLYGLSNKTYSPEYIPSDVSKTRATFDERFEAFKQFVNEFNRIPYASGIEEEESLARWKWNVLKRVLEVSDAQVQALSDFIEKKKELPSSGIEVNFKRNCIAYLDFVNENFEQPNYKSNHSLASWYSKNLNRYQDFTDNRRIFFEKLLNDLRGYGFC